MKNPKHHFLFKNATKSPACVAYVILYRIKADASHNTPMHLSGVPNDLFGEYLFCLEIVLAARIKPLIFSFLIKYISRNEVNKMNFLHEIFTFWVNYFKIILVGMKHCRIYSLAGNVLLVTISGLSLLSIL